jgi:hypothetical protein
MPRPRPWARNGDVPKVALLLEEVVNRWMGTRDAGRSMARSSFGEKHHDHDRAPREEALSMEQDITKFCKTFLDTNYRREESVVTSRRQKAIAEEDVG